MHFNWYPYTGEEAPMPLDDIEHFFEEEEEGNSNWFHTIKLIIFFIKSLTYL